MVRKVVIGRDFVTVSDIANYCAVSRATVRRWVSKGELSVTRLPSGHCRVNVPDFLEFLTRFQLPVPPELSDLAR